MNKIKPFSISKNNVWEAYVKVRSNKGSAGIDNIDFDEFERYLKNNLYKLWNRMSAGSYFPKPVKSVDIPKKDGGKRTLGIPTISDRIAQMVVKQELEPTLEKIFHEDSFGYRPKKSAHDAVILCKSRCWKNRWVVDVDIKGFFDNINHELVMKAVRFHTNNPWVILYIERWLRCAVQKIDGELESRNKGTPQGGVISPLLANLYLHYAFDEWIKRNYPKLKFERYADDIVIHCPTKKEAQDVLSSLVNRMRGCYLEVHPLKTKIVFCSSDSRGAKYENPMEFNFLGFTFRRRTTKDKLGNIRDKFLPGISKNALRKISSDIASWKIASCTGLSLTLLLKKYSPQIRGWVNYYRCIYTTAFRPIERQLRQNLIKWATRKYKKFKGSKTNAGIWIDNLHRSHPYLFVGLNWN